MNYLTEIKAFYDLVQIKQLSTGQIALWNALMYINNKCAWVEWFTVSNLTLQLNTGMSRSGIKKARNSLKQYGIIDFKENGTKASSYKLLALSKSSQDSNQDGSQNSSPLNKLNKTKQNNKKNIKKNLVEYGENKNVKFTDEEFEKVKIYFPNDYMKRIQTLDDYMQSTGKKYKDYFATLKNWARREGYISPNEKTNIEYKEVKMTEEEYYKNKGGKEYV